MAFPQGINFRDTNGYVTDGANYDFEPSASGNTYPRSSAQGNTVGWESGYTSTNSRDRDNTLDVRLAGLHFTPSTVAATYRIDLPSAGDYIINYALGDIFNAVGLSIELFDNVTSLGTVNGSNSGVGWWDASGTLHNHASDPSIAAASWVSANPTAGGGSGGVTKTFASTICRFTITGVASSYSSIASFFIKSAGGTNTTISPGKDDLVISLSVPSRSVNTYMFPDADITDGGWVNESESNVNLFASVDEFMVSDSDFIKSGTNPSNDMCEIRLSNSASTPAEPFEVLYRYKKSGTAQIDLVVDLVEGGTIRKTWTHTNISTSYVTAEQTLSSGEFASITDFDTLRLRFTANKP